jgi:uncharacterized membrane protein YgcG
MNYKISRAALLAGASLVLPLAAPAYAQATQPPPPATELPADDLAEVDEEADEIVVTGQRPRGSVIGDIPPENTLNSRDVRATGATDINELLEALAPQIGSARGREGGRPITLLNGQRVSSFRELRDIPTEAIQRVEILPEEVALKYGYRADQRVVNIILRERFRSTAVRAEARTATEGDYLGGLGDVTRLMIGRDGRTTINLRAEGNDALREADRDVDLETGATDERDARTLVGSRSLLRATAAHNRTLFGDVSATINGEVEHSKGRSLLGFPGFENELPITGVLDARVRNTTTDSAHAGLALNGDRGEWRWSVTGNGDVVRNLTRSDPDDVAFGRDRARSTRSSGDLTGTANGPLFKVPAGEASATVRVGAGALHIDSRRRREDVSKGSSVGRTQGNGSVNFDLPVSRRRRDFDALGNLTLNANAEVEELSDFGTLTTIGAGANWSPVERLNFITSWTREEGAPSVQQLGEPILDTPGSRIFDFTRGETVLVNAITGGNPDLAADKRSVWKIGGNWKPLAETDLRLRGEYVRSRLQDPVSSFPGPSAALEDAFPDRFQRAACAPPPCVGELLSADLRPVNFDSVRRDTFRWGFDFTKPLRSARPSQAVIDQFRAQRRSAGGEPRGGDQGTPPEGPPPDTRGERGEGGGDFRRGGGEGGGGFGGGRFGGGGFGGGRQGGRLTFSLTHTMNLRDEVIIGPGLPELDYLRGDAVGSSGGRPRHEIEAQAGWANNGLGARLSADWRSGTRVDSVDGGNLRFSPLTTFDLRLFANLGERFDLVARHPWLRGTQLRLEVRNLLDAKPRVRDDNGGMPFSYQSDLLDPLGRTVGFSIRKLFSPPPSFFRRERRGEGGGQTPGS